MSEIKMTVAQAEPGMEFFDVVINEVVTNKVSVGGKTVTSAILKMTELDGSIVALTLSKNIDVVVRYGDFMKYAKRVNIRRRGASTAKDDGNGVLVSQAELELANTGSESNNVSV